MVIVTATNDNYAQHLAVMLTSLLENVRKHSNVDIYIICGKLSKINKRKLIKVIGMYKIRPTFISVSNERIQSFKMNPKMDHISIETFYRIIIPDLLDKRIKKAIYLDSDLIVKSDISGLWNINIRNDYMAAVAEDANKRKKEVLSIPAHRHYFNAGVLLINVAKWRENKVSGRIIRWVKKNQKKMSLMDQDALNAVLCNHWVQLEPKWNYTTGHWKRSPLARPAIIHYTGKKKPWNSNIKYKEEYDKYLQLSLWGTL